MGVQYHNNAGNHIVAVIKGEESYKALESFKTILDINDLIQHNKIEIAARAFPWRQLQGIHNTYINYDI